MRPILASCVFLSLAVTAACTDDAPPTESSGSTTTSMSGGSESTAGPSSTSGTMVTSTSGSTGEGSADSSTGTTGGGSGGTSGSTSTSGDATGSTTGGPSVACAAGCAVEFMCGKEWATEEDCVAWCEANLLEADAFSPYCRDAWESVSACLGTLTCEEFATWQNPTMFPYPCSDTDVVLEIECEGQ